MTDCEASFSDSYILSLQSGKPPIGGDRDLSLLFTRSGTISWKCCEYSHVIPCLAYKGQQESNGTVFLHNFVIMCICFACLYFYNNK